MPITSTQARAARAALALNGKSVAEKTGIFVTALHRFEKDGTSVSEEKLKILRRFYQNHGIEFSGETGVRLVDLKENRTYTGVEGFRLFMDDVYETARDVGGEIFLFNSKPSLWIDYLGQEWYDMHAARMADLGNKINFRIMVQEGEQNFILGLAQHRWLSGLQWKGKIVYGYGQKLAFLEFLPQNGIKITVMNSPEFNESFRVLFDIAWDNA